MNSPCIRERRRDDDVDREVRLVPQASPDPLRLMEDAARIHWRAAAWLLERSRPEEYARKPANTARDFQVEAALGMLFEAALAATAPAERFAFYEKVQPVCGQALQYCFPQLGPGGNLKKSKLPPTPLADEISSGARQANLAAHQARVQAAANDERVSEWFTVPSSYDDLSPKTSDATPSDTTTPIRSPITAPGSPTPLLSPKTRDATPGDTTSVVEAPSPAVDRHLPIDVNLNLDDLAASGGVDPTEQAILSDQRLRRHAALRRRKERQAAKQAKAAKKRSAASRRRNAD